MYIFFDIKMYSFKNVSKRQINKGILAKVYTRAYQIKTEMFYK